MEENKKAKKGKIKAFRIKKKRKKGVEIVTRMYRVMRRGEI